MVPVTRPVSKEATQQRIIDAAVELFSRHGFRGTSLREIARNAGLNEVTLFRYYPRKLDLFLAALEASAQRISIPADLLQKLATADHPGSVLREFIEFVASLSTRHSDVLRLIVFGELELQFAASVIRESMYPLVCALSGYLARCMKAGVIRTIHPDSTAWALVMATVTQFVCNPGNELLCSVEKGQVAEACTVIWLHGLLPNTTSAS